MYRQSLLLLLVLEFLSVGDLYAFQISQRQSVNVKQPPVDMQLGDMHLTFAAQLVAPRRNSVMLRLPGRRRRHAARRHLRRSSNSERGGSVKTSDAAHALWPQLGEDNERCSKKGCGRKFASQTECQNHAISASHGYYDYRASTGCCMTQDTCEKPSAATDGDWRRYYQVHKPPKTRTFLMALAHCFHGSTALEGMLMSSKKLTTLCSSGVSNCEGGVIMMRHAQQMLKSGDTVLGGSYLERLPEDVELLEEGRDQERFAKNWNYSEALDQFSQYWDLDRPVLFDKTPNILLDLEAVYKGFKQATLPAAFRRKGVSHLEYAFVLMWRPSCLWKLSSHALKNITEHGMDNYAQSEKLHTDFHAFSQFLDRLTPTMYRSWIVICTMGIIGKRMAVCLNLARWFQHISLDMTLMPENAQEILHYTRCLSGRSARGLRQLSLD